MQLEIELVPRTCWCRNLREHLRERRWDQVRRAVYEEWGRRCDICGAEGRLHCHERWSYDDEHQVQKLEEFIALCEMCHHVKHIGHAGILAREGRLDLRTVVDHFCHVNECGRSDYRTHRREAFAQLRERSKKQWWTDLGDYS
jgi:hypothetical protein